jgi:hypothetical protein
MILLIDWLVFNVQRAIFQLYSGRDETLLKVALNTINQTYIPAHNINSIHKLMYNTIFLAYPTYVTPKFEKVRSHIILMSRFCKETER